MGHAQIVKKFLKKSKEWGLTAKDFDLFCEHHNISLHVADQVGRCVLTRKSTKVNHDREKENHPLITVITDGHCYDVRDPKHRKNIANTPL